MSKKHFIALADAIRQSRVHFSIEQIEVLADFLQMQNPRFQRVHWMAYVHGEGGPNPSRTTGAFKREVCK